MQKSFRQIFQNFKSLHIYIKAHINFRKIDHLLGLYVSLVFSINDSDRLSIILEF